MVVVKNITSDNIVVDSIKLLPGLNQVSIGDFISISLEPGFISKIIQSDLQIVHGGSVLTGQDAFIHVMHMGQFMQNNYTPHKRGITVVRKSGSVTTQQTNAVIWTPANGKRFVVTDFIMSVHNNTLGAHSIQVFDEANSNGNHLINDFCASGSNYPIISNYKTPFVSAAINNSLRVTTSGAIRIGYSLRGYEVF